MNKTTPLMTKKLATKPPGCTEFQFFKNLGTSASSTSVVDFTEFKLKHLIKTTFEVERKRALTGLLVDYQAGKVAVGWQNGSNPMFFNITKDTKDT